MFQSQDYIFLVQEEKMANAEGIWLCEYCTLYLDGYCFIKSTYWNLMVQNVKKFKHYLQYINCKSCFM
jgi:ribosomal protein L37AE/L43A